MRLFYAIIYGESVVRAYDSNSSHQTFTIDRLGKPETSGFFIAGLFHSDPRQNAPIFSLGRFQLLSRLIYFYIAQKRAVCATAFTDVPIVCRNELESPVVAVRVVGEGLPRAFYSISFCCFVINRRDIMIVCIVFLFYLCSSRKHKHISYHR